MQEIQEIWVQSLGQEDPLEEGMAPHTSILAWRNPLTEGPGGLWFIGSRAGLGMHTCAYYHLCHDTKFHCFRACLVALVKQVCEPILGVYVRTWKTLKWL